MADYNGTDEDDIIDGSELPSDISNIYPKKGNDQLTNLNGQTVVASPGDDSISGTNVQYAFWHATESPTINLLEGWADDGFGYRDTISGITTIHGTSLGMTITGTSAYEHVLLFGGNNTFNMGGGDDKITYHLLNSTDYVISSVGDEVHVTNSSLNTLDIITGVKKIVFSGDNKTIDIDFLFKPLKAEIKDTIHTFNDDTFAPAYIYAGVSYEAKLISWFSQAVIFLDINQDGIKDVIAPMWKGYGTGIDTSTPFIAFTTKDGTLTYDAEINVTMPITTGGRRSDLIQIGTTNPISAVTVSHSTEEESKRNSDSTVPPSELILIQSLVLNNDRTSIFPKLPFPTNANSALFEDTYPFAVDAHSMAVGDINGDGLDDIFIGHSNEEGPYELIQQNDGTFLYSLQPLYVKLLNWPLTNEITGFNVLLDTALVDINNDGFDDLIAGFGSGSVSSLIFINDNGQFSEDSKIALPDSVYGTENQYHMKTMPSDFDHDGDIDLAIHWARAEPYYGGNYIQILLNDGQGNFTDVTNLIPSNSLQDAYGSHLEWREPWQLIDMNNDGHMDIAGSRSTGTVPLMYLNDGEGRFEIKEIALDSSHDSSNGTILGYEDFDQDNIMEIVIFRSSWTNDLAEESINSFYLLEMSATIGTGPDYVSGAESDAPGFNERYYLNENSSAEDAVTAGTYASGLKHYLAVGKDESLKTFAINTKVHGYSGNDNIVLREGDETAYGYAGNDTIDGGLGTDTAVYRDEISNYSITRNDDNSISVKHLTFSDNNIDDGTDILTNIENIEFTDKTIKSATINYSDDSLYTRSGSNLGNSYTIKMIGNDPSEIYGGGTLENLSVVGINVLSKDQIKGIMDNYEYVIKSISKTLSWKGTLDFVVVIQGDKGHPTGLLPSMAFQHAEDSSGDAGILLGTNENRVHVPTYEQLSGIDLNGDEPDLGFYINITENNEFKNYDTYVWIDPKPSPTSYSNLPEGQHDLISIITHEIVHAMGVAGTSDPYWGINHYSKSLIEKDGQYYYSSERMTNLIGKDLLTSKNALDHHVEDPEGGISGIASLMSGQVYSQRWSEPGPIEYAILYDAGWTQRKTGKLSETIDSNQNVLQAHSENTLSGTLNFNAGDNIIILDGQAKNYRGLSGDDTYFVSQLIPKNTKLSITDTDGSNIIQVPANTYVDKSLFTKNAARLTLEDGREITINSADKFSYNIGGNVVDGTKGTDLTFTEFAEVFGVYDILNSSGAQTGSISDMYII